MASQDKKISALTAWFYQDIVGTANIVVAHLGGNYKIAMSAISQYVLGNRRIGTNNTGDIVTIDDEQQLTDKILISPGINSPVEITATSTEINYLEGLDRNVKTALDTIGGDILVSENRVEDLSSTVNALQADKIYLVRRGAGATSITILASTISEDKINPYSLSISVYGETSISTMKLLNLSNISISTDQTSLKHITIGDVEPEKTYRIVIRYRLVEE